MTSLGRRRAGFTLIEVMIVVAIIGVLGMIAYPSYLSQLAKSRRSDARSALVSAAQAMERFYTEHATYVGAQLGSPGIYASSSTNGYYTLTLSAQSTDGFSLSAMPTGVQSSDACGSFTYDQTGTKGVAGGSLSASDCW